jgi:hypothetical protein
MKNGFGSELFSNKKNEGLEPTLSNNQLKMKGWNRHCRMIGKKMKGWNQHCRMIGFKKMGWNQRCQKISKKIRAGAGIVDSSSHFPMIGAQLVSMAGRRSLGNQCNIKCDTFLRKALSSDCLERNYKKVLIEEVVIIQQYCLDKAIYTKYVM